MKKKTFQILLCCNLLILFPSIWIELIRYDIIPFANPILSEMEYDSDKQTLTISPFTDSQALRYQDDGYTEGVKDWGNAPKYWIVQKNDFATGEPLKKPIVTLFTVNGEKEEDYQVVRERTLKSIWLPQVQPRAPLTVTLLLLPRSSVSRG